MTNDGGTLFVDAQINVALQMHQGGRLSEAATLYRAILKLQPAHGMVLQMLGVIACQCDDPAEGAALIGRAIAVEPASTQAWVNFGFALQKAGRLTEAAQSFRRADTLDPSSILAKSALGDILLYLGLLSEAEDVYRRIIIIDNGAQHRFNLARVLHGEGRLEDAVDSYISAIKINPIYPDAYSNIGCILKERGLLDEALSAFCTAIDQMPNHGKAYSNLGCVLRDMGRLDEAEAASRKAVSLIPASAEAHFNLGGILQDKGLLDAAETFYRSAIALSPDYVEAHWNLALLLLKQGRFKQGWAEHEWRLKSKKPWASKLRFPQPMWRGEALEGKTILIHREQGLGDVLQFVRYVSLVAARGGRVVLLTYPSLERLLRTVPGVSEVVVDEKNLPAFDCHVPILSLPFVFGTEFDTIPADVPYIYADPVAACSWQARLRDAVGLKVGVVWSGGLRPNDPDASRMDRQRSLSFAQFAGLANVPGVTLVSLQKGPSAQEVEDSPIVDFMAEIDDFADTAALVDALDLVITVDTSVAHLAGAMGKPVWILSRFDGCWRWLENSDHSPWYPHTARLFRQTRPNNWSDVLTRVREALARLVAETCTD